MAPVLASLLSALTRWTMLIFSSSIEGDYLSLHRLDINQTLVPTQSPDCSTKILKALGQLESVSFQLHKTNIKFRCLFSITINIFLTGDILLYVIY